MTISSKVGFIYFGNCQWQHYRITLLTDLSVAHFRCFSVCLYDTLCLCTGCMILIISQSLEYEHLMFLLSVLFCCLFKKYFHAYNTMKIIYKKLLVDAILKYHNWWIKRRKLFSIENLRQKHCIFFWIHTQPACS